MVFRGGCTCEPRGLGSMHGTIKKHPCHPFLHKYSIHLSWIFMDRAVFMYNLFDMDTTHGIVVRVLA